MKVVCIAKFSKPSLEGLPIIAFDQVPIEGEIYTPVGTRKSAGLTFYLFEEIPHGWNITHFREADDTFGPAVCERIEEMIEYEEAVEA